MTQADTADSAVEIRGPPVNLDVIKTADWIIDLGPEGGDGGGEVIATGTPENVAQSKKSFTGQYLKPLVAASPAKKRA